MLERVPFTGNLRTKILDFRVFDSSVILVLRGGILIPIRQFPKSLRQAILVGRLGVPIPIPGPTPIPMPQCPYRLDLSPIP